jgi:hypothetical protein
VPTFRRPTSSRLGSLEPNPSPNQPSDAHKLRNSGPGLRHIERRANGQPAIGWYLWDEDKERFAAAAIEVYSCAGERLTQITVFASPELFQRFGLPAKLAA